MESPSSSGQESKAVAEWNALWMNFGRSESRNAISDDEEYATAEEILEDVESDSDLEGQQDNKFNSTEDHHLFNEWISLWTDDEKSKGSDIQKFEIDGSKKKASDGNQEATEGDDGFDLSLLPADLQMEIIDKMPFKDYVKLNITSKEGNSLCHLKKYRCLSPADILFINKKTLKVIRQGEARLKHFKPRFHSYHTYGTPPARMFAKTLQVNCEASRSRIKEVCAIFERNRTTCNLLACVAHVTFEPEDLDELIRVTQAKLFYCSHHLGREYFRGPAIQQIRSMEFTSCGITDEEFVKLDVGDCLAMETDTITARGINEFLLQWKRGEREIMFIDLRFDTSTGTRNYDEILNGLDANLFWSENHHDLSIVRRVPAAEYAFFRLTDRPVFYSLWRHEDIDYVLVIILNHNRIIIGNAPDEKEFLICQLSRDQLFLVMGICKVCKTEVCKHRRRYGASRMKRNYTSTYNAVLSGIRVLSYSLAIGKTLSNIHGERPFSRLRPPSNSTRRRREGVLQKYLRLLEFCFGYA